MHNIYGCIDMKHSRLRKAQRHFHDYEISMLKQSFSNDPYPTQYTIKNLSDALGVDQITVYNWFSKERIRRKKGKVHMPKQCKLKQ